MSDHREEEQSAAGHLAATMRQRAEQLRALADGIDRTAVDVEELPGIVATTGFVSDDYATHTARAVKDVLWGVANLNLDMWITHAHTADRHRHRAQSEEAS